jgi:rod shape-determining protein MreD
MQAREKAGGSFIAISFLVALVLSIVPLPEWARPLRPEFIAMLLIYWCLSAPERVGVGFAWFVGIVMDVAHGVLLGQHALTFTLVAWATAKLHQRIRLFPIWQQALSVFLLIVLSQMLTLWIKGMAGQPPETWKYWLPSVTSFILWPWFFVFMRGTRRYFLGSQ